MLKRPQRIGILAAVLAYLQATALSLTCVVCIENDGGVCLESSADHCCIAGVPRGCADHDGDQGAAAHESGSGQHHDCAGCVDVPVLGASCRVSAPSTHAPLAPVAIEALSALRGPAPESCIAELRAHATLRPPGLAAFDRLVLNC